ncbi:hypothetical protein EUTSA_v10024157mg [Eutrema salsugineum]|uniref:Sulfotransferase n=1 Tax=Eutrema salsugineum TaxID=72664 RepID=V4JUT6_EUTSA|nr:hypothetical protein EUTSA_v10024157mg [Eutrema salsugineum]
MDLKEKLPVNVRDDKISEETKSLISSLPSHTDSHGNKMCRFQGCWYYYNTLQGVLNFQRGFQPQDTDIILASYPKSGTTWLKALTVALLERSKNHSSDHHPLLSHNPQRIVPYFELGLYIESSSPDLTKYSSVPRLFSTHMPLDAMHETLKDSPCKIVYVCRNVKDTLRVLFMRYEEMKAEPHDQIKRLADFLGCPFTKEEKENGCVDEVLDLCSLRNLSGLEINKTGKSYNWDNKIFFRKGEVGDWKNYLTPEMENKIDMIIQEKLQGSGLKF